MIKTGVGKSNNPDAAKAGAEAAKEALTEAGGKTKEIELQRERELQEMDRIAKMLVRRDLELSEIREKDKRIRRI